MRGYVDHEAACRCPRRHRRFLVRDKPVSKQAAAELALRPDFRICGDEAIEVDCGLFHGMHGHTANVVGLGEEVTGTFNATDAHAKPH